MFQTRTQDIVELRISNTRGHIFLSKGFDPGFNLELNPKNVKVFKPNH